MAHIRRQPQELVGKIRDLQRTKDVLLGLTSACSGRGPLGDCPILAALNEEEDMP